MAEDEITGPCLLKRDLDSDVPLLLGRARKRDRAGAGRMDRERRQAGAVEPSTGRACDATATPDIRGAKVFARNRNDLAVVT